MSETKKQDSPADLLSEWLDVHGPEAGDVSLVAKAIDILDERENPVMHRETLPVDVHGPVNLPARCLGHSCRLIVEVRYPCGEPAPVAKPVGRDA